MTDKQMQLTEWLSGGRPSNRCLLTALYIQSHSLLEVVF